jgi:DnaJ-class molecular chaperone
MNNNEDKFINVYCRNCKGKGFIVVKRDYDRKHRCQICNGRKIIGCIKLDELVEEVDKYKRDKHREALEEIEDIDYDH